jgi:hypothetical protein
MPTEVLEVTKKFMRDPVRILVKKEELTLEGIKQFYVNVGREVSGPCHFRHPCLDFLFLPVGKKRNGNWKHCVIYTRR